MFEEELRKYAINTKFSQEYTHAISVTKNLRWSEFEPTKFVYAFFNFNTIYQVDWDASIDTKKILRYKKILDEEGKKRNLSESEQQRGLLDFILSQIDLSVFLSALSRVLNSFQRDGIDIVEELEKITPDENVTNSKKQEFINSVRNMMSEDFDEKESFQNSLESVVRLIYNVRNNIFHGRKGRFELENGDQQIRLRIYAEILQCVCQLAIEAVAKRADAPQILKSDFEQGKRRRARSYSSEISLDLNEILDEAPLGNLFYPCSGLDTCVPLKLFLNSPIQTFCFADISYKNESTDLPFEAEISLSNHTRTSSGHNQLRKRQFRQSDSLIGKELVTNIERKQADPVRRDFFSLKTDFGEVKIPNPRFGQYELTLANGQSKQIQIYGSDAFSAFQSIDNISVFFYRFDGIGEGGSNQLWFSASLFRSVLEKMSDGGLVITDGGNGIASPDLKLRTDQKTFRYNDVIFDLCGKIDNDTRVWKIQK